MRPNKSDPRRARTGAEVQMGAGHRQGTARDRDNRRFREPFALTATEVETALAVADCPQLARALDGYSHLHTDAEVRAWCPRCDRKQVSATSRWRWRCDACDASGAWVALRQLVAMDTEACCRLSEIVHGVEVSRPARDTA
jgi:ribosomal protein L37AE/L43A